MSGLAPKPYVLRIYANGTQWMNANGRGGWQQRLRLSRVWRRTTCAVATSAEIPHFEGGRVVAFLHFPDGRRRDPSNWAPTAKACMDGLVDAGVFDDDDYTRVEGPDMRMGEKVSAANRGITLHIYPREDDGDGADRG